MTNGTELMSSAPWIWPMMMSWLVDGAWPTDSEARSTCWPLPALKLFRLTSSVRGCSEFGVVAPLTGAQNLRQPELSRVSHGGALSAGLMLAAVPFSLALGRVSFQPDRSTALATPFTPLARPFVTPPTACPSCGSADPVACPSPGC